MQTVTNGSSLTREDIVVASAPIELSPAGQCCWSANMLEEDFLLITQAPGVFPLPCLFAVRLHRKSWYPQLSPLSCLPCNAGPDWVLQTQQTAKCLYLYLVFKSYFHLQFSNALIQSVPDNLATHALLIPCLSLISTFLWMRLWMVPRWLWAVHSCRERSADAAHNGFSQARLNLSQVWFCYSYSVSKFN